MCQAVPWTGPFVVAHRAGNDLELARRASSAGARVLEADLHRFAGRVEVRHLKTVGPVPLLWDKWTLAKPWAPRLLLHRLLEAVDPDVELMLDLKGRDRRLVAMVFDALAGGEPRRAVTVCARSWPMLDHVPDLPWVRRVHSVGTRGQLAALRRRFAGRRLEGISIHRRLLDPATVADLRRRAELVMTWPVETPEQARELAGWGVDGMITERYELIAQALA